MKFSFKKFVPNIHNKIGNFENSLDENSLKIKYKSFCDRNIRNICCIHGGIVMSSSYTNVTGWNVTTEKWHI